ncbi:PQQ-binding-like beta-propeller repeat protein [bacterium]|nr:PQQ-binding-like beta-propeller repeat protein [bacterium]
MASFAFLYEQLSLGVGVGRIIEQLREPYWLVFLRAHRGVLEISPMPAEVFLSLAQGHAAMSAISIEADAWLRRQQPAHPWLRLAQRPEHEPAPPPTLLAHDGGAVLALAVSANGRRAVSGGHDYSLRLWDLEAGEVRALNRYSGSISRVALGSRLLVVESSFQCESTLRILDADTLAWVAEHRPSSYVLDVELQGDEVYYAGWDRKLWKWNWASGEVRALDGFHEDHITALTRCGPYLVSGCADGTLGLWEAGQNVRQIVAHSGRVAELAPTDHGLLSSGYDGLLKLWDVGQGVCLREWPLTSRSGCSLAASADGRTVVVGDGCEVFLLDLESGQRRVVESAVDVVSSVAITPDDRYVLCGSIAGVRVWDLRTRQQLPTRRGDGSDPVRMRFQSMVFTPDGQRVVSGTLGGRLHLWDFATGACLASLEGHRSEITSVLVSPDGTVALSGGGSQDYRAHSWDLARGACMQAYEGHRHRVFVLGINDHYALSASWDGQTHLWDLRSGERLWSQSSTGNEFLALDGLRELRGDEVYAPREQSVVARLEGLAGRLAIYASSRPFGLTKTEPRQLWDLESGQLLAKIPGSGPFSPRPAVAGDLFAYAASSRELAVFDVCHQKFLCRWPFSDTISSLAIHTTGAVVVALDDGQLQFLHLMR